MWRDNEGRVLALRVEKPGNHEPAVFALSGESTAIGRDVSRDISLDDALVSRRHAVIATDPAGIKIRDLGSCNGTWLNGARIQDALLQAGDILGIGGISMRLD
jgi:pSer/pThr/pTyr-binding forkhead associated (FHA) protein